MKWTHYKIDIFYVLSKLGQLLDVPTDEYMLVESHVLKYLKNNLGKGLFFISSSDLTLKRFFDSD